MLKILRIELPEEEFGKYLIEINLGGIVKLGLKREKVGDILVSNQGADIVVVMILQKFKERTSFSY